MKGIIFLLIIILVIAGCSNQQANPQTNNKPVSSPITEKTPVATPLQEAPKETCEQKAAKLIPQTFKLQIHSSYNPNVSGWDFNGNATWEDGMPIDKKGTIEFQKGRSANQNTNYWYTINIKNEKLFGAGGLRYVKQVTTKEGITGKNFFMIKPVLNPIQINGPSELYAPYTGVFQVIDRGFVNCSWIE